MAANSLNPAGRVYMYSMHAMHEEAAEGLQKAEKQMC